MSREHEQIGTFDADTAQALAECMQVLSTPSRIQIVGRLKQGACSVGELADAVDMERSAVSRQRRLLRHLGFVVGKCHDKQIVSGQHDSDVAELLDQSVFHVQHLRMGFRDSVAVRQQITA